MKAWSHLPNAHHIDWVLASLKETPELWDAARAAAWDATMFAVRDAARDATMFAVRNAARDAAWENVWIAARFAAWDAARATILAFIAYDDCDHFLNMSYEKLKVWALLSEDPRAVLLLPMIYVKEKLNEQSMVTSA